MKTALDSIDYFSQQDTIPVIPIVPADSITANRVEPTQSKASYIQITNYKAFESKIDTIRRIPEFSEISTSNKTLIATYQQSFKVDSSTSSVCYIVKNQLINKDSLVFLESKTNPVFTTEKELVVIEKLKNNFDWVLLPTLIGFVFLAIITTLYRKYIGQFFERVIYHFSSSKNLKDRSIPFQSLTVILDFLFIISFSMMIDLVVRKLGLYIPPSKYEYLVFILVSVFLFVLRTFRWVAYRLTSLISGQNKFFGELYSNSTLYTRTLGVFLLPIVFLIAYTSGVISTYLMYFSILITIIFLIFRIIRLLRVFVVGGFSIFYFILYLCALEIAPLLIIWKEVSSR